MAVRAGALKNRITIQTVARVADGQGGFTETWSELDTVRAELRGLSGTELIKAGRLDPNKTYRFWVRYLSTITEACRIVWNGSIFNILHVAPDNKRRQMEILAEDTGQTA